MSATVSAGKKEASALLAAMADGIGDLTFASAEWTDVAGGVLSEMAGSRADDLADLGTFKICEVAWNPPAYLHIGPNLAWHARISGGAVQVGVGELDEDECDFKVQADHSLLSNMARLQYQGRDPGLVAAAQQRLLSLGRWDVQGAVPEHPVLGAVLRGFHDAMAVRTMPRFWFMTPEWVSSARHILTERATSDKYADGLKRVVYTFSEEFTETPRYAFPDGSHGGFWVRCDHGQITVGAGPLPESFGPADALTRGPYTPIVPVGRTVNRAMTESDQAEQTAYSKAAFRFDKVAGEPPVEQSSPSGRGEMPPELSRVFMPLHDELGKRTSGELPSDYDPDIREAWAIPQSFDRRADYDASWVRYGEVDVFGDPIES